MKVQHIYYTCTLILVAITSYLGRALTSLKLTTPWLAKAFYLGDGQANCNLTRTNAANIVAILQMMLI